MKQYSRIFISVLACLAAFLVGCGKSVPDQGKWLDYGNGIVNLSRVQNITHEVSSYACALKFDNFTLNLGGDELPSGFQNLPEETQRKTLAEAKEKNEVRVNKIHQQIIDFLKSNETYLRL